MLCRMHSILLHFGPLTLKAYGAMMALGFAAAWFAMVRLGRGSHRNADYLASLCVWLMLAGLAGARLAYVAEHWTAEFAGHPWRVVRIDQGGVMFYGGVAGATLALLLFVRRRGERLLEVADLVLAALPLGHAFGRLGCFLHGCCHGRVSPGPLAVAFPAGSPAWEVQCQAGLVAPTALRSLPVVPTQLFEAAANLLLFVVLAFLYPRLRQRSGVVAALYFLFYPAIRFAIEPYRGDLRLPVGPFSVGQAASLALFGFGVLLLALRLRRRPEPPA
jgi:phosphatidylglycerol:prolipoprotein diacylglycerol transferase